MSIAKSTATYIHVTTKHNSLSLAFKILVILPEKNKALVKAVLKSITRQFQKLETSPLDVTTQVDSLCKNDLCNNNNLI